MKLIVVVKIIFKILLVPNKRVFRIRMVSTFTSGKVLWCLAGISNYLGNSCS